MSASSAPRDGIALLLSCTALFAPRTPTSATKCGAVAQRESLPEAPKKLCEVGHGLAAASQPCRRGARWGRICVSIATSLISGRLGKGRKPSVEAKLCELDDKAFGPDF